MISVVCVQLFFVFLFSILEISRPALQVPRQAWFWRLTGVSQIWAAGIAALVLGELPWSHGDGSLLIDVALFYTLFSFANYWWHRARHSAPMLWRWLHSAHHSPTRMDLWVAMYRNPLEIAVDAFVIFTVASASGASAEVVLWGLCIEGCLEIMHHSNTKTPKWARWIGYVIQLPEMHRVHHQRGAHSGNYGTVFWDWPFRTLRFNWDDVDVGLSQGLRYNYIGSRRKRSSNRLLTGFTESGHYKGQINTNSKEAEKCKQSEAKTPS